MAVKAIQLIQIGTPIRTKSRKTLKSNVEMIAIENTGL